MKSNAPWSVKGIERDARETAKEAAKREGMTVGEWLNQMIYAAGDPESSGGNVEGLKLRDVVTAIDHLHKRIADSSAESGEAVTDLSRKMGDVVERVQRLERTKPGGGDRERVDALKALEKAVSQVAVQFSNAQKTTLERLDASEQSLQKLTAQIDSAGGEDASGVGFLKDAVDGLQTRMARTERLVSDAGQGQGGDPAFVESTDNRLRVLGDEIKRGGDQIRTLETTIGKLSQQIEAAERRSAEGVQKTAETLAELREKFSGEQFDAVNKDDIAAVVADHTRDTTDRVDRLQTSFERMIARLDAAGGVENFAAEDAETTDSTPTLPEETAALAEPAPGGDDNATDDLTDLELIGDEPSSASEETPETAAASDDEDDDDDFFSFADEIDASIEETPASEREDDFSFELEDDNTGDEAVEDPEGAAILSEVQGAFSGTTQSPDDAKSDDVEASDDDTEEAKDSIDSELDELLAGLDDVGETPAEAASDDPPPVAEAQSGANADGAEQAEAESGDEDSASAQPSKEDLLKSIRRKAREDAAARATSEESGRPTRRKLTPKQKAILAARARRKRLLEQGADEDAQKAAATKKALAAGADEKPPHDDFAESAVEQQDDSDDGGKFAEFRARFPFFGGAKEKSDDDRDATTADLDQRDADGDQEALETLKSTAATRPVTLALGVGIFLVLGLLFFLVKDFVFSPRTEEGVQPPAATAAPAGEAATEPTLEAPAPPAIDPTTLYRDAMTGLNAAGNDAETGIAMEKLEQAALLGHPPAQLQLGELYKTGQGVDQDLSQARTWFRRAANGGNVLAMHRVGVMTARGEGGSANTPEAIGWFEQAANRGLVDSQYNLGAIYHPSGEGEPAAGGLQDAGKAYYWYSLASQNGDEQATPLAAGVGAALSETQRAELDEAIGAWTALPADVEANTLASAG